MNMSLRYPNITGRTEREQLAQVNSYLRQMVDQLNFALQGQGSTGQVGADGKDGKKGADGKTPQKGVDYWTPDDVQEIVSQAVTGVLKEKTAILKELIPVGSPYASKVNVDPSAVLGFGTWEKIEDRFILAASDNYPSGSTGGEAKHALTVDEMPSHSHMLLPRVSKNVAGNTGYSLQGKNYWWITPEPETGSTSAVGGSEPHNNMPPYYAMYVWIRTA